MYTDAARGSVTDGRRSPLAVAWQLVGAISPAIFDGLVLSVITKLLDNLEGT